MTRPSEIQKNNDRREKWVVYKEKWFNPKEWNALLRVEGFFPEDEAYHDIEEVLKDAQEKIKEKPTTDRLERYFIFEKMIRDYYKKEAALANQSF